jgi:hypothetical protein
MLETVRNRIPAIYTFLLGMTDIFTSQNIDPSSCDILYIAVMFWTCIPGNLGLDSSYND